MFLSLLAQEEDLNPFAKDDAEVNENVKNLMGLAVGVTKNQGFSLAGVANYMEGYDWGSAWFYKIRKKEEMRGNLANKDVEEKYMPVRF